LIVDDSIDARLSRETEKHLVALDSIIFYFDLSRFVGNRERKVFGFEVEGVQSGGDVIEYQTELSSAGGQGSGYVWRVGIEISCEEVFENAFGESLPEHQV